MIGPRFTVYLCVVDRNRQMPWSQGTPDDSISSPGQRNGRNWVEELPWVLLGLRAAPRVDLGYSSAELTSYLSRRVHPF
ncbi:hypothetical protein PoB_001063200 [Plakobranchus ocellatus]|uniref:Uncharacterized protein n=1 Tax=Plakobranchus ocellatus TaxID=259542 RepID=A0AAV3YPS4_9GAST|nr:hypothetical protein PoB_001063200 [Plakobranchus ocellatus]